MYGDSSYHAIVLAGGSGTRLWPLSRTNSPKQFLNLFGSGTLLQSTVRRIEPRFDNNITFVVSEDHADLADLQVNKTKSDCEYSIIGEPGSRNTAPAIYLGLMHIVKTYGDPVVFVFPADHYIEDNGNFLNLLEHAGEIASLDYIVTFGIKPSYAETGYGYIHAGKSVVGTAREVTGFKEKPDINTAKRYMKSGNYYWNSGMFAFKPSVIMEQYRRYIPEIPRIIDKYLDNNNKELYSQLPDISFDNAIMERTEKAVVVPVEMKWSDLGSWRALYDIAEKDKHGNYLDCDVISHDVKGCYVKGKNKLFVLNNVKDLVIVDSGDTVLISDMNTSSEVKNVMQQTDKSGIDKYLTGKMFCFPWGYCEGLDSSYGYSVKKVIVYPGKRISLHKHELRDERWTITRGKAKVTLDSRELMLNSNDSVYIERGALHGLENTGEELLEVIEIQFGDRIEEDDITMIDDDQGKIS